MNPGHLSPDEFRSLAKRTIDLIADYWASVERYPVLSQAEPGDVLARLPVSPPHSPSQSSRGAEADSHPADPSSDRWDPIFSDLHSIILPNLTHWQSPNFFAFFPANASFPAILGELLAAGLGQQGMLWATSPACTELEMRMLDWLAEMLGLPDCFRFEPVNKSPSTPGGVTGGGVIQGTASEATLTALVAARHRALKGIAAASASKESRNAGAIAPAHPHLVAYASTQAHSSFIKACMIAGLAGDPEDRTHVRLVPTDDSYAMDPAALAAAIREDVSAGRVPFFVMATIGSTSSTAIDPLDRVAPAMREFPSRNLPAPWLHVDAAHAGSAAICPEFRWILRGIEHADSFCFNPHKWLLTNFDCDCFYVRDRAALIDAMSVTPEYLRNAASQSGQVIDYRDWHVPLGRRFRSLKLWLVIRHYGVSGLQAFIREHVRFAQTFDSLVRDDARFEIATDRTLNLVCFRMRPLSGETASQVDQRNRDLLGRINASGRAYLTHTILPPTSRHPDPRLVLRMAIGATLTQERHVRAAWDLIRDLAGS